MDYQKHLYYKHFPNAPGYAEAKRASQIRMGQIPQDYGNESDSSYGDTYGKSNLAENYKRQMGRLNNQNRRPNSNLKLTNQIKKSYSKKQAFSDRKQNLVRAGSSLASLTSNLQKSQKALSTKESQYNFEVRNNNGLSFNQKNTLNDKYKRSRKEANVEISIQPSNSKISLSQCDQGNIDINQRSYIYSDGKEDYQGAASAVPQMEMETVNESNTESDLNAFSEESSKYYEDSDNQAQKQKFPEERFTAKSKQNQKDQGPGKNQKYLGLEKSLNDDKIIYKSKSMGLSFANDVETKEKHRLNSLKKKVKKRGQYYEPIIERKQTLPMQIDPKIDMRKVFIDAYGVELDFAGYYYSTSRFIPNQKDLIITVCWHIVPDGKHKVVQTTTNKNTFSEKPYESIYNERGKGVLIQLMKPLKSKVFKKVKEIQLHHITHCLIEFSKNGKLLGLYNMKERELSVYNSTSIVQCLDLIQTEKHYFKIKINFDDNEVEQIERIVFDLRDKYIGVISKSQVRIVKIKKKENQDIFLYKIPEQYDKILDIVIDSRQPVKNNKFNCQIACGWELGRKIIGIFDIHDDSNPEKIRQILCREYGNKLSCKISDDTEKVVFSNGLEHYILKDRSQDLLTHIGEKQIHGCNYHEGIFYFVNSSDQYDRDVVIQNSKDKISKAKIARSLEPGQIKVFDSQIFHETCKGKQNKCLMRVLMHQGDYLFLDTIDLSKSKDPMEKYSAHINTCTDKFYMAYGFNWPYFSYASKYNFVFILNAFNPNFVQRYELPKHVIRCDFTFLTDTHDLYAICEIDEGYEVYNVDLDSMNPYLEGPILRYSYGEVGNQELLSFHVRASSRKEKINLNKALIFFMMHGGTFYGWCDCKDNKVTPVNGFSEEPNIEAHCSNYYYLSDDSCFYMISEEIKIGKKFILHSQIKFVECQFGSYKVTDIYQDKDKRAEILNFGVDNTNNRLLILSGIKNPKNKRDKFATLFSFNRDKIIFTMKIKSPEIIGRLKSNLYNFVGGHIYYNNKVIKIRYDLLDANQTNLSLEEDMIFDHYQDVLCTEQDDEVQSGTPLQTCLYNRLAYVIRNQKRLTPRKVLILPYLHERKLYLNRRHTSNQFYNLMKHQNGLNYITCLCIPENKMYIYSEMGILIDRINYLDLADKYGKPMCISENGTILLFRKSIDNPEIHIVLVHLDKLEYVETINIKERLTEFFEQNKEQENDDFIKEVNAQVGIFPKRECFGKKKVLRDELEKKQNYEEKLQYFRGVLNSIENLKNIHIEFYLNDDGEVLLRLQSKKQVPQYQKDGNDQTVVLETQTSNNVFKDVQSVGPSAKSDIGNDFSNEFMNRSFLYFIPNDNISNIRVRCKTCYSCSQEGQEIENKKDPLDNFPYNLENRELVYFDSDHDDVYDLQGISMNQDFIFFWNKGKAWKLHMASQVHSQIGIYIDEDEIETYIKKVFTSSNKGRVYIRVKQSETMDCMIIWDLWRDVEVHSFDIKSNSLFMQDRLGNVYLAENDYLINCQQQCKLKCYRFQVQDFEESYFSFNHGYRVDEKMHNYVLMRNYVNLSFSYMTFIIKRNFDNGGYLQKNYLFDCEGYDYILKRNTIFTEGHLVTQDYDKLYFILSAFAKIDKVLLEQLFYCNDQNNSPLHIAVSVNNTRMVNVILQFLSKIDNGGIETLKNIFKDLIDYKDFSTYLLNAPFQTLQMEKKQTLQIPLINVNQEIIKVSPSRSSYVDVAYFEKIMGEDKQNQNYKTYACKIYCVKADWILKDDDGIGMEFMQAMLKKKNRDIFMTPYMMIIIQFLYEIYSRRIKLMLLPPYIAHLIFVNIQLFVNEHMRDLIEDIEHQPLNLKIARQLELATTTSNLVVLICGMFNFVNMIVFVMQSKNMGCSVFLRAWSVVDIIIILTNTATCANLFIDIGTRNIRLIECILVISQWFKCLYYMRLVKAIAPLIESIFVIIQNMLYFLFIFLIGIIAFAEAYYSIGKNQQMLDQQNHSDNFEPSYASIGGAFADTYMSALGQLDISQYGNGPMAPILYFMFVTLSFIMCIHMLNMLVAIMGQSFDRNEEISDSNNKISQLEFVVNNWWIHPIQDKKNIVYFVSAFAIKEDNENFGKLEQMGDDLNEIKQLIINQYKQMNEIQYQISQIITQK